MNFEFATAGRIIFGEGTAAQIPDIASAFGKRALVITGRNQERSRQLLEILTGRGIAAESASVAAEPSVDIVDELTSQAREFGADQVIALGGGSVIDTGKAVAAMLTNPGEVEDYLEVVGKGKPITRRPVPCIAMPTTAGTGAEVTRNSVLSVPGKQVKVSMRSPLLLPAVALVDPELTYSMPPELTAATGLDALTQLLEAFVTPRANPMTNGICREGLSRAVRALPVACLDGANKIARHDMALASLFGGLALANAGLGAVHGFAGPLGRMIDAPHGAICACLLPYVTEANIRALETRKPASPALDRYAEISRLAVATPDAGASDLPGWLRDLCRGLKVKGLTELGLTGSMIPEAVAKAGRASSMKGNPVELQQDELAAILERAL